MIRIKILILAIGLALAGCATAEPERSAPTTLYDRMTDADVAIAAKTVQATLEKGVEGKARDWKNAATGSAGSVTPLRTRATTTGLFCRDYRETLTVGGETASYTNSACRNPEGRWIWTD